MRYFLPSRLRLLCFLLLLSAAGRVSAQQTPGWQWATSPGTGGGTSAIVDATGNVYVAGAFSDTVTFGATTLISAGSGDIFIAKLSDSGVYQWAVRAGGSSNDVATGIALDSGGNMIVTGYFNSDTAAFGPTTLVNTLREDVFVAKLTPSGTWQWASRGGGNGNDISRKVAVDSSGSIYITGAFNGLTAAFGATILTGAGTSLPEMFVAKLTPAGAWQWALRIGNGSGFETGTGVVVDGHGDIVVSGLFDGPSITFGSITLVNTGRYDVFVAKLTPTGVWQWAARAGGSDADVSNGVTVDASNNVIVTGSFSSPTATFGTIVLTNTGYGSAFVAKLTPTGTWQWATCATGTGLEAGTDVAVDSSGVTVAGWFFTPAATFGSTTLTSTGSYDIFVAKLTPGGVWQWAIHAGGNVEDRSAAVALTSGGDAIITGYFRSAAAVFGSTTLANTGGAGIFFGRVSAPPQSVADNSATLAFTLAPNPAHTTVTLTGLLTEATATLFDALGRAVRTAPLSAGAATLDVRGLAAGVYVVRAGAATRRLVVE